MTPQTAVVQQADYWQGNTRVTSLNRTRSARAILSFDYHEEQISGERAKQDRKQCMLTKCMSKQIFGVSKR